jgi:hypothetical protein
MAKYGLLPFQLCLRAFSGGVSSAKRRASDIDMTTLVSNLDNTASEIVAYQRDSTVQRKDLAQKTKDFRKLDDATKLVEIKGLLKGTMFHHCSLDSRV